MSKSVKFVKIQWAGEYVVVYDPQTQQDLFTARAHRENLPVAVSLEIQKRGYYTDQIGVDRDGKLRIWI